jgi:hypothetical protein
VEVEIILISFYLSISAHAFLVFSLLRKYSTVHAEAGTERRQTANRIEMRNVA